MTLATVTSEANIPREFEFLSDDGEMVAVVTGATRGLGSATASLLVQGGWTVLSVGRSPGLQHSRVHHVRVDLRESEAPAQVRDAAIALGRPVRLLVNNAGANGVLRCFGEADFKSWLSAFRLNFEVHAAVTHAILPLMAASGLIVNIGSGLATRPESGLSDYAAAKAALAAFSNALALDLRDRGIGVLHFSPGLLDTRMTDELLSAAPPTWRGRDASPRDPNAVAEELVALCRRRIPPLS